MKYYIQYGSGNYVKNNFDKYPNIMYISYYSDNYPYKDFSVKLKNDCEKYNINYDIENYTTKFIDKSWCERVTIKPMFILSKLQQYPEKNIVWIDIDTHIRISPEEFNNIFDTQTFDIAIQVRPGHKMGPANGLVLFKNNKNTIKYLEEWIANTKILKCDGKIILGSQHQMPNFKNITVYDIKDNYLDRYNKFDKIFLDKHGSMQMDIKRY